MADKNKFYQREKEINGTKYVAQFNGMYAALKAIDDSHIDNNSSNIALSKIAPYVLKNVIVEPNNLTVDDFDTMEELNEVVTFGMNVMQGKFRDENKIAADEGSEE